MLSKGDVKDVNVSNVSKYNCENLTVNKNI